jgi:uncharacterized protein with PQ loop repeat
MVIAWVPQVDLHLVIALNNMVEMLISQIIAILRRRSSEGVSFWMILLANISGITGLLNGFVLQWHVVHCCLQEVRRLATHTHTHSLSLSFDNIDQSSGICLESLLSILQLSTSPLGNGTVYGPVTTRSRRVPLM